MRQSSNTRHLYKAGAYLQGQFHEGLEELIVECCRGHHLQDGLDTLRAHELNRGKAEHKTEEKTMHINRSVYQMDPHDGAPQKMADLTLANGVGDLHCPLNQPGLNGTPQSTGEGERVQPACCLDQVENHNRSFDGWEHVSSVWSVHQQINPKVP